MTFDLVTKVDLANWKEEYYSYRDGDYKGMKTYFDEINWLNEIDIDNGELELSGETKKRINNAIEMFVKKRLEKKGTARETMW